MNKSILKKGLAAALLPLAMSASLNAQAADALAICEPGQPYLWGAGGAGIPFNPDQGNLRDPLPTIDNPTGVGLVQAAFDDWTAGGPYAVPTTATYANAGPLPVDVDFSNFGPWLNPVAPDGYSAIVFDADGQIFDLLFGPGSGILGFAGPEWGLVSPICEITEGRAFLNGPAFSDLTAAEDVMMHEFGHYSNLGHVELNGQLFPFSEGGDTSGPTPDDPFPFGGAIGTEEIASMFPFYFGPGSGTQSPHADDVASIATLYPAPGFLASTGTISGTIYAADGTTRLSGVNVIARNVANPMLDAVSTFSGTFTDGTSQADPFVGRFTLNNLTPGADYVLFVDQVTANPGRFSNPILSPLPGPEEYWNADEDNSNPPDAPLDATLIVPVAGSPATGMDIIFNQPGQGEPLPVGDDGFVELPLGFTYDMCGTDYTSVWINANGNLTFGSPDGDFSESVGEFLGDQPRIAGLWDDLNPSAGGVVTYYAGKNWFQAVWDSVPEFFSTGSNSFSITLKRSSRHIDVEYGGITAGDGLAGVSCGGAITSGFESEEDLGASAPKRLTLKRSPARFEHFSSFDNDLDGTTVLYNGTTDYNDNWTDEPNDSFADARHLNIPFDSIPVVRFTEIEPTGGDVDYFYFETTGALFLNVEILTGELDTVIALWDSAFNMVGFDDDGGTGLLSKLSVGGLPAGTYYLAVTTFPDYDFTGDGGSGGRFVLDISESNAVELALGDDDSEEVPLPFTFPFNGGNYTSVFVNSNGSLTFGSGDTDFSESVSEFLNDQPRIAPLWDDLSPNQGGSVSVEYAPGEAMIMFDAVPQFLAGDDNTFTVTLRDDGSFTVAYGNIDAGDGIAGATEGGGAADPGSTDLSGGGPFSASGTTYEQFNFGNPNDLDGLSFDFNP
ncbi:MAG: hypothetical protein HKN58_02055 [Xanthomonadales bacterium]|nr:hypothetical protein [Xanthomonadales bacterium]